MMITGGITFRNSCLALKHRILIKFLFPFNHDIAEDVGHFPHSKN